jgi:single-stranded-DNA-specific exonuclease
LIESSGRDMRTLTASDIGYALAPRINAAGRLEDMALGIECLLSDDPAHARTLAATLDGINAERKGVQQQMTDEAEAALARVALDGPMPPVLCLFDPQWHPGVVGLVASRMKDRVHRPVVAFAPAEPGSDALRGSARSIAGLHIRDALAAVDVALPGLIPRFGGHAMAAGLSLPHAGLAAFAEALQSHVERMLDPAFLQSELLSDGELHGDDFHRRNADCLRDGGPWGQGFPSPCSTACSTWSGIASWGSGISSSRCARRVASRRWTPSTSAPGPARRRRARAPGLSLAVDDYRGGEAIQLIVEHMATA